MECGPPEAGAGAETDGAVEPLQSEYEELCISMTEKDHLQEELDALSLAGETIQSLSVQMQSRIGDRLKQQMSKNAVIADEWPLSAGEYG